MQRVSRDVWRGPTYYGRAQLKPAPFNNWVVGGYIFLAGLSGGASLLGYVAGRRGRAGSGAERRSRYLGLLAPLLGAPLLIYDLHTPKRFYNMFRVAKGTSPMSIGTWILSAFSLFGGLSAACQMLIDVLGPRRWLRRAGRAAHLPAAMAGAGLGTYTAALLAATSTPLWAAAPRALAVRFAASSMASGAAALLLLERNAGVRRSLQEVAATALAVELAADFVSHRAYRARGVAPALQAGWGRVERLGATGLGTALPFALLAGAPALGRRGGPGNIAPAATLLGSFLFRVAILGAGGDSARRPEVSFRFAHGSDD